jgi:ferredoxin-like protein FixX
MDMLFPANPLNTTQNNYVSPNKNGTTPSQIEAQNALRLEKTSLVPENEEAVYRRTEDADEGKDRRSKKKRPADEECQTCKERRYKDVSNDSTVSFQTPTKLDRGEAAYAVRAHEQEHVSHEQAKAEREGREVVSQNVVIHYDVCPECGKVYVAGGTTTTATRSATPREKLGAQYNTGVDPLPKGSNVDAGV